MSNHFMTHDLILSNAMCVPRDSRRLYWYLRRKTDSLASLSRADLGLNSVTLSAEGDNSTDLPLNYTLHKHPHSCLSASHSDRCVSDGHISENENVFIIHLPSYIETAHEDSSVSAGTK